MKFGSLFTGIGGFDLGLEQSGHESVWQAESDKYCNQVLDYRWPHVKRYNDVKEVNENAEDVELIVGGFPCQSFSVAGNRKGFEDTRGTLFFEFARILKQKQPQSCIIENVRGLLSHDKGRTFQVILNTLDELGYDAEWQLLNSKNFGVPQNRSRIFIIGHLRGRSGRKIFPIARNNSAVIKYVKNSEDLQPKIIAVQNDKILERDLFNTLDASYYKGLDNHQQRSGILLGERIRRLTPKECERLQGFSDDWTEYGIKEGLVIKISNTQRYKQIGNAVTVPVIKFLGERMNG